MVLMPSRLKICPRSVGGLSPTHCAVPLVLAKNTIERPERVAACNSRVSVTTALLTRLKLPRSRFAFDGGVLGPSSPRFTFFAFPGTFKVMAPSGTIMFSYRSGSIILSGNARGNRGLSGKGACLRGLCSSVTGEWIILFSPASSGFRLVLGGVACKLLRSLIRTSRGLLLCLGKFRGAFKSCFVPIFAKG